MRAWGHGMTWWARTAQKSGSRLLLEAAVPVWLWSACKAQAMWLRTNFGDLEHRGSKFSKIRLGGFSKRLGGPLASKML